MMKRVRREGFYLFLLQRMRREMRQLRREMRRLRREMHRLRREMRRKMRRLRREMRQLRREMRRLRREMRREMLQLRREMRRLRHEYVDCVKNALIASDPHAHSAWPLTSHTALTLTSDLITYSWLCKLGHTPH